MAVLKRGLQITGRLGGLTVYERRDIDKLIVRTPGGASRDKIMHSESFAMTRKINKEWSACSKMGLAIRNATQPVKHMADYNISGPLNAVAKTIQKLDQENSYGTRGIYISKYKTMLTGFSFNTKTSLDSVIRHPFYCSIDRALCSADVRVPDLIPGLNFINPNKRPLFRIVATLGAVSDMVYIDKLSDYKAINEKAHGTCVSAYTSWLPALTQSGNQSLNIIMPTNLILTESDTLILAIGVEFGNPVTTEIIEAIKYSGSAKLVLTA